MDTKTKKIKKLFNFNNPFVYNIIERQSKKDPQNESETEMEPTYNDYKDLIYERAWSFAKSYSMDIDDLISVGNDAFMKAREYWDPDKAAFTTFLYRNMNHAMLNYIKRIGHRFISNQDEGIMELRVVTEITPRDILEAKDDVKNLDDDCRFVIRNLLDNPEIFGICGGDAPCNVRAKIKKTLRYSYGWKYPAIWKTLRKLRVIYSNKN